MYLGDGIFMNGSPHNTVTRNVLSNNHMFGISLWDSTENAILGNVINANEQFGVPPSRTPLATRSPSTP